MNTHKLTPREATDEMCWAAEKAETRMVVANRKAGRDDDQLAWCVAWQAMHDAAPALGTLTPAGVDALMKVVTDMSRAAAGLREPSGRNAMADALEGWGKDIRSAIKVDESAAVTVQKRSETEWMKLYIESPEIDPGVSGPSFLAGFLAALRFVRAVNPDVPDPVLVELPATLAKSTISTGQQ